MNPSLVGIFVSLHHKLYNSNMNKNENFEIIWGPRIQDINVTKCTASWEPSEVSFLSNNDLEQDGPSLESSLYLNMTLRYLGPGSTFLNSTKYC